MREAGLDIPVILLAYNNRELTDFLAKTTPARSTASSSGRATCGSCWPWSSTSRTGCNVAHDTGVAGVPAIIVVEDNIRFYSSFLPVIYSELVDHTHG